MPTSAQFLSVISEQALHEIGSKAPRFPGVPSALWENCLWHGAAVASGDVQLNWPNLADTERVGQHIDMGNVESEDWHVFQI